MGSCANAIFDIEWQNWGAEVASGSGSGCVQYGDSPRYEITASDPGLCAGIPAYRTLQIGTNPPQVICAE